MATETDHEVEDRSPVSPRHTRPGPREWNRVKGSLPAAILAVGIGLQAILLVGFARQFWFVMDDWDFLLLRGTIPEESRGWLEPRNGHWSTLTIAIYRALFAVFGLRTYLPYALVTIVFHLAIAALWFVILRRLHARKVAALIGAWVILFLGIGGDAILYSAAMNHLGSLLLGLIALLLALSERPRTWVVAVPLVGALMFSNTGVSAVFFVVAFVAIRHGLLRAARLVVIPAGVYVLWYLRYGHVEAGAQLPTGVWDYLKIPQLVWQGMSAAIGNALGYAEVGPAVLVALLVGTALVKSRKEKLKQLAWAGLLAAVFMSTTLSLSRQFVSPDTGRYSYYTVVFLVPAVALCIEGVSRLAVEPRWLPALIAAGLLGGYAVNGVLAERTFAAAWVPITRPWQDRTLGMVAAVDAGERSLNDFSGDFYNGDINPQRITKPNIREALPPGKATPQGRIDAEALYMVRVGTTSAVLPAAGGLDQITGSFTGPMEPGAGCHTYTAQGQRPALVLGTGRGNEITVTSQSTEVVTQVLRGQNLASVQRMWTVAPGTIYVSTTAKDALLFITLNGAGEYTICKS